MKILFSFCDLEIVLECSTLNHLLASGFCFIREFINDFFFPVEFKKHIYSLCEENRLS